MNDDRPIETEAAAEADRPVPSPVEGPAPSNVERPIPILADDLDRIDVRQPEAYESRYAWLMLLLFGFLFLWNAGAYGLWDPWETHYGEVTQNMIESYDWVSPWWGFKEKVGDEPINGGAFLSKPILIFWAEATFVRLIGYGDWAIRLPIALMALATVMMVYWTMTRLVNRRTGFFAALVMATAPQFVMIARQAQTDMPFVSTLTVAMMFAALAFFSKREPMTDARFWRSFGLTLAFLLLSTLPQFGIIATDLTADAPAGLVGLARVGFLFQRNGVWHSLIYLAVTAVLVLALVRPIWREWRQHHAFSDAFKDLHQRRFYLYAFYVMMGHATLAKGLLGFMLPGFILLGYIGLTWEWRVLKRMEVGKGAVITLLVLLPWYVAMFAKHGMAFYSRFIVHDHFNRLASGVHALDSGTYEHFLKWLGIGLYPWAALVPFAFLGLVGYRLRPVTREGRLKLFLFLWFFLSWTLFTLAQTKFHHYIFPALPPLALLIGLWIVDFDATTGWMRRLAAVAGLGLFVTLTLNLSTDVQHIRNLCTYKYDRPLPKSLPTDYDARIADDTDKTWAESTFARHTNGFIRSLLASKALAYPKVITALGVIGGLGFALFGFWRTRRWGLGCVGAVGVLLTLWVYQYYLPMLSPAWSQKYLFEDYYDTCTPAENDPEIQEAYTPLLSRMGLGFIPEFFDTTNRRLCKEQVISWLLTWRGETYYTFDTIIPINKEATQFEQYMRDWNRGRAFYVFMQQRGPSFFETKLNGITEKLKRKGDANYQEIRRWKVEKLHFENNFFTLMKATPVTTDEPREAPKKPEAPEPEVQEDIVP